MIATDLEIPKLRKQVINRIQSLDYKMLLSVLSFIDKHNISEDNDDYVDIDFHFPTPETPEEAMKEMEEIEAEIQAGKVLTLNEFMTRNEKKLKEYECPFV
ncbi:MAG: hypothetical protein IIU11_05735 [Bacteroidales bacterium]|jgi:RNase adaptor protein for sRNA GlmZ degradation|nr:hypothetical protein [Bacteroidales bacterium]